MFSRGTKTMLKNVIRHTDTHNRILEEDDMWTKRIHKKKTDYGEDPRRGRWEDSEDEDYRYNRRSPPNRDRYNGRDHQSRPRGEIDRRRRRSFSRDERDGRDRRVRSVVRSGVQSACFQVPRAHMDREQPSQSYLGREDRLERSDRWNKDAIKAEEADPDRWGHSGYKKLYPEEFISTDEEEEFWKRKYSAYYASGTGVKTKEKLKEKHKKKDSSSRRHENRDSSPEASSRPSKKYKRSSSREVQNHDRRKRHLSSSSDSPSPKSSQKRSKKSPSGSKKRRYRRRSSSKSSSSSSASSRSSSSESYSSSSS